MDSRQPAQGVAPTTQPAPEAQQAVREPPRRWTGALRHIGPGIIVSGSIVGSGELIVTSKLGAEVGFVLLWLILASCFVKVFVQIEIGRFVIATGRTALDAFEQMPGPWLGARLGGRFGGRRIGARWLVWLWAAMAFCSIVQLAGILLGLVGVFAVAELGLGAIHPIWWIAATVLATSTLLISGRYREVELVTTALVCVFTILTLVTLLVVQTRSEFAIDGAELASGLWPSLPPDGLVTALAVLGITGVGASELVYYPYWCLEKGYGRFVGPPTDDAAWRSRAAGWIRVMQVDAWVSFAIYTLATVGFYLLGAATLHRRGLVPGDDDIHAALSFMYTAGYGTDVGLWLYAAGAVAVLYSTFFVATASNSRVFADAFRVFGLVRYRDAGQQRRTVGILCAVIPLFCWVTLVLFGRPVSLILIGGIAQAALLPFLAATALYLRYRSVPPELAPRSVRDVVLWVALLTMLVVGGYEAWSRLFG